MALMQTLIRKINSWFEQPEIKEAERFEDWYARLNPKHDIDMEVFNEFHSNLRKVIKNDVSQSNKKPRG
jgi:hypothetical protein